MTIPADPFLKIIGLVNENIEFINSALQAAITIDTRSGGKGRVFVFSATKGLSLLSAADASVRSKDSE